MPGPDRTFWRFCLVGAFGFLIDAAALLALMGSGLDPYLARAVSLLVAVTATWICHRHFTFGSQGTAPVAEWARFVMVNGLGIAVNYAVYATLLTLIDGLAPLTALVVASALALAVNYTGARHFAFRTPADDHR